MEFITRFTHGDGTAEITETLARRILRDHEHACAAKYDDALAT